MDIHKEILLRKHVDQSPHERKKAEECVGDLKLIWIKTQDLPTDTVAQWVEHRRVKPRACVRILISVRFFICSVAFIRSLLPMVKRWMVQFRHGFAKFNNVDKKATDKYNK